MTENKAPKKVHPKFRKIMIVDDDEPIREMLKAALEAEGFQVRTEKDGRNIISSSLRFGPNLIISDVMMPGGGGYELLTTLQADAVTRQVPVIVMSGKSFDSTTKDMFSQQPNVKHFFEKPLNTQDLVMQVHTILNTKSKDEAFMEEQQQQSGQDYNMDNFDGFKDMH